MTCWMDEKPLSDPAGSKEDNETVSAFFQDLRARGLGDLMLVVSDALCTG